MGFNIKNAVFVNGNMPYLFIIIGQNMTMDCYFCHKAPVITSLGPVFQRHLQAKFIVRTIGSYASNDKLRHKMPLGNQAQVFAFATVAWPVKPLRRLPRFKDSALETSMIKHLEGSPSSIYEAPHW